MMFPPELNPVVAPLRCKECGAVVKGLGCPICLMKKSLAEIIRQQSTYVLPAVEGRMKVTIARWRAGDYHVALFGHASKAFCGKSLKGASKNFVEFKQLGSPTSLLQPYATCKDCIAVFGKSVQAAKEEQR